MTMPGFTANASVYKTNIQYQANSMRNYGSGTRDGVTLAAIDPCAHCGLLPGCARFRCFCICNDGVPIPVHRPPCNFVCT
jgi:hypothetical protein